MAAAAAKFSIGELVHHKLFDYRGVIIDVDPIFQGSPQWYDQVALSRPPKDQPWYHVLVHQAEHQTYVAERNLEADETGGAVVHPLIATYFEAFTGGVYRPRSKTN